MLFGLDAATSQQVGGEEDDKRNRHTGNIDTLINHKKALGMVRLESGCAPKWMDDDDEHIRDSPLQTP